MIDKRYNGSDFLINFYDGAYGPTIRIDTHSIEPIEQIKSIFLKLATAETSEINFLEVTSAKAVGVKSLILRLVTEQKAGALNLTEVTDEGSVFYWLEPSDTWLEYTGLIDGILKQQRPGHQYLTNERTDDAILVIAFQET
jgi:hypothetical protein